MAFFIFLVLQITNANASEVDPFTFRNKVKELKDAAPALNRKMNAELVAAANKTKGCNQTGLHANLVSQMGGFITAYIELWPQDMNNEIPHVETRLEESIYQTSLKLRAAQMLVDGCCAEQMKVNGAVVSSDKLGHFFQQGFERFYAIRKHSEVPLADPRDFWTYLYAVRGQDELSSGGGELDSALKDLNWKPGSKLTVQQIRERGVDVSLDLSHKMENGPFGGDWGIKSYADIAADVEGYKFWSQLTETSNPYFKCRGNKWQMVREFKWEDYVSDAWDEAINCNEYSAGIETVAKKGMAAVKMFCPIEKEKCAPLRERYGNKENSPIHPSCGLRKIQFYPEGERPLSRPVD